MGRASRKRAVKKMLQRSAAQQLETENEGPTGKSNRDVKSQAEDGGIQKVRSRPFVHVDYTAGREAKQPEARALLCTAQECTRGLSLIGLMRRLGLGPEQESYKQICNSVYGMGSLCDCHDVRVAALQKATQQVLKEAGYGAVADIPHAIWYDGPRTGVWNNVKIVAKRILRHKRQCRKRKDNRKTNDVGHM